MGDWNYYNDFDAGAAEWLRELIKAGHIPDGEVDERSILDVEASELSGFTQCHFFAGIGGWPLALRLAGWPTSRPVWTGSPPCQPFSVAGEGKSRDDERHLAPKFAQLVGDARPPMLFGEQVASAAVFGKAAKSPKRSTPSAPEWAWLDDLSDRLEAALYAVGASDFPSAGVGAPHIRQRTFFGAYDLRLAASGLPDASGEGLQGGERGRTSGAQGRPSGHTPERDALGGVVNSFGAGLEGYSRNGDDGRQSRRNNAEPDGPIGAASAIGHNSAASPLNGFWQDADWLFCRDGKWRPVEPGSFPLAHGLSDRVGLLRGYGNAINPWAAAAFIETFNQVTMETPCPN